MYKNEVLVGYGAHSQVFFATHSSTQTEVALKVDSFLQLQNRKLRNQHQIYTILNSKNSDSKGIPKFYQYVEDPQKSVLAIERLGISIEDFFIQKRKVLQFNTIVEISKQILKRIKFIHNSGVIHCDIKPDNFMFGLQGNSNVIYIADFGLSRKIEQNLITQIQQSGGNFVGSLRYASLRAHQGAALSKRDDLQSFCYLFLYLLNGALPWQNINKHGQQKFEQVKRLKKKLLVLENFNTKVNQLLNDMLESTRRLSFNDQPKYQYYLRQIKLIGKQINQF